MLSSSARAGYEGSSWLFHEVGFARGDFWPCETSAVYLSPTSKRSGNQRELGHASWPEQSLALEVALARREHYGRFRWRVLFVSLSQLTEQHAGLSTEQVALTAAIDRRPVPFSRSGELLTSEKRDQDSSLPTKVSSEEHVVLERSAEPTGRRVADEPLKALRVTRRFGFAGRW